MPIVKSNLERCAALYLASKLTEETKEQHIIIQSKNSSNFNPKYDVIAPKPLTNKQIRYLASPEAYKYAMTLLKELAVDFP